MILLQLQEYSALVMHICTVYEVIDRKFCFFFFHYFENTSYCLSVLHYFWQEFRCCFYCCSLLFSVFYLWQLLGLSSLYLVFCHSFKISGCCLIIFTLFGAFCGFRICRMLFSKDIFGHFSSYIVILFCSIFCLPLVL